jgi:uncharacterized delta-60 repeat protein
MLRKTFVAAAAAALVAVPAAAQAAPGDIDTTFGAPLGFVNDSDGDIASGVVALPGGGTVLLTREGALIAYTAAGLRDTTFGSDGRVSLIDSEVGTTTALARDAQGRLLVGGREQGTAFVARLTPTGDIDEAFGQDGRTAIAYGRYQDHYVTDLAVAPDGRVLVGGYANASGRETAALARLTTAGALDTTFAADGTTTFPNIDRDTRFAAIAPDATGGVYAAGSSGPDALVVHTLDEGQRDLAFDGDGERAVHIGDTWDRLEPAGLALTADGLFASALQTFDAGGERSTVLALDPVTGASQAGFGTDGLAEVPAATRVGRIVTGSGDGLLVVGSGVDEGSLWQRSLVARLDATTGAPDPRFAGDGVRSLPFDTVQRGVVLARDGAGRVTIGGQAASQLLAWRVADVDADATPSGGGTPSGGATPTGGGGAVTPPPGTDAPPAPVVEEASAQDTPVVVAGAAVHRPAAWFHRVRSALRLKGEADPGAARVQVSITQRDGKRCRAVTSTRRARLGSRGACAPARARWLTANQTPRTAKTQLWSLHLARRLPAGRYTATVRALDREGLAGQTGEVTFRVR